MIPPDLRPNIYHLIMDIAWFGVLNGSVLAFLSIYAARIGASALQLGMITAVPAVVNLGLALPSGDWLARRDLFKSIFLSSLFSRVFYLLLIPLPVLFPFPVQVIVIILITLLLNIPGTALAVGFTAMYAEAVPIQWRGHAASARNVFFAIFTMVTSLLCGFILESTPFLLGYQIVFGLGFLGAMASSAHLFFVRPAVRRATLASLPQPVAEGGASGATTVAESPRIPARRRRWLNIDLKTDVIRGPYGRVVLLFFFFHLTQYLAIPIFPLYQVDQLQFTDQVISLGTALYYIAVFLGATQLVKLVTRFGNQKIVGLGVMLLGGYPAMLVFSQPLVMYILTSIVGGLAWALINGGMYNYLLERVEEDKRPASLAWYNIALNAAILAGSVVGPVIAGGVGLAAALLLFAGLRFVAGFSIFKWG
ncbi:MAG: MFS transporter [Chloroflexi bacterium]|nr:MFS transporter [Chloroflexota bacterium]